jgi:gentisate 1,2-dioxygenase
MASGDATSRDSRGDGTQTFRAGMSRAGVRPLWERTHHNPREPVSEKPRQWRWSDIAPLLDQAVEATSMETAECRVLSLHNPDFDHLKGSCVTTNLNCGFQILMPGETARVHRHTADALRFVVEGSGGRTIVDGKVCLMEEHDLIITPGGTWHKHVHEGESRIVWLDALDVPFMRYLDCQFFDPGPEGNFPPLPPDESYRGGGVVPQPDPENPAPGYSPLFRYRWADVEAAFAAMPGAADGSRRVRYADPQTGGPAMRLFDLYAVALAAGTETRPFRSTANAFCLVVEGRGRTRVGEATLSWSRHDVFSLPHWNWISHCAEGGEARLFMGTDREILRRLDLLREEHGG